MAFKKIGANHYARVSEGKIAQSRRATQQLMDDIGLEAAAQVMGITVRYHQKISFNPELVRERERPKLQAEALQVQAQPAAEEISKEEQAQLVRRATRELKKAGLLSKTYKGPRVR